MDICKVWASPKEKQTLNLYYIFVGTDLLILVLHVDDLFLTSVQNLISGCKAKMEAKFEMEDMSMMHYFLGLEVWQTPREIFLEQGKYAFEILKRFQMKDYKPMATPMIKEGDNLRFRVGGSHIVQEVDRFLDIFVNSRLDICFVVNTLSPFMVGTR
jgi:hypothetical protein